MAAAEPRGRTPSRSGRGHGSGSPGRSSNPSGDRSSPPIDGAARDYSFMTDTQLVEMSVRLATSKQWMEMLLEQLLTEKAKLVKHQETLNSRIEELISGAGQALAKAAQPGPPGAKPALQTFSGDAAAGSAAAAVAPEKCPEPVESSRGVPTASTLASTVPPCSEVSVPVWAVNSGAASQSAADTAPTVPTVDLVEPELVPVCEAESLPGKPAECTELSVPEELMVRPDAQGSVRLTWFYDEDLLEQLSDRKGDLRSLTFEVRQQSEVANGRLRTRLHSCSCKVPEKGQDVGEQSFVVEGCIGGRVYLFSVRARAEFAGGRSVDSEYTKAVSTSIGRQVSVAPTPDPPSTPARATSKSSPAQTQLSPVDTSTKAVAESGTSTPKKSSPLRWKESVPMEPVAVAAAPVARPPSEDFHPEPHHSSSSITSAATVACGDAASSTSRSFDLCMTKLSQTIGEEDVRRAVREQAGLALTAVAETSKDLPATQETRYRSLSPVPPAPTPGECVEYLRRWLQEREWSQQKAALEAPAANPAPAPAAQPPTAHVVQPAAAVQSSASQSTAVQTTAAQSTAVQSTATAVPTTVQSSAVQSTAVQSTAVQSLAQTASAAAAERQLPVACLTAEPTARGRSPSPPNVHRQRAQKALQPQVPPEKEAVPAPQQVTPPEGPDLAGRQSQSASQTAAAQAQSLAAAPAGSVALRGAAGARGGQRAQQPQRPRAAAQRSSLTARAYSCDDVGEEATLTSTVGATLLAAGRRTGGAETVRGGKAAPPAASLVTKPGVARQQRGTSSPQAAGGPPHGASLRMVSPLRPNQPQGRLAVTREATREEDSIDTKTHMVVPSRQQAVRPQVQQPKQRPRPDALGGTTRPVVPTVQPGSVRTPFGVPRSRSFPSRLRNPLVPAPVAPTAPTAPPPPQPGPAPLRQSTSFNVPSVPVQCVPRSLSHASDSPFPSPLDTSLPSFFQESPHPQWGPRPPGATPSPPAQSPENFGSGQLGGGLVPGQTVGAEAFGLLPGLPGLPQLGSFHIPPLPGPFGGSALAPLLEAPMCHGGSSGGFVFRSEGPEEVAMPFENEPPPRSAPGYEPGAPMPLLPGDLGAPDFEQVAAFEPPPRRSAPASEVGGLPGCRTLSFVDPRDTMPQHMRHRHHCEAPLPPPPPPRPPSEPSSPSSGPGRAIRGFAGGSGHALLALQVRTSESRWETMEFAPRDDLHAVAEHFTRQRGLRGAFLPGLVAKMRQMLAFGREMDSVDIVDLI